MNTAIPLLILASSSPRRKDLLSQIGLPFHVLTAATDETSSLSNPKDIVEELSLRKGEAVKKKILENTSLDLPSKYLDAFLNANALILSADTLVSIDGRVLGKPNSENEAFSMLSSLSGRKHDVFTGVSLISINSHRTFHEKTRVSFYEMTEEEILSYIKTGEPMDKAGSYGIQGLSARFIKEIEGDYTNVVGLPLGHVYQELKTFSHERL